MFRLSIIAIFLIGCTNHINAPHYTADANEGFMRSYVSICPKLNGRVLEDQCKTTLCNGYAGFVSDIMRDATILGAAALIGPAGLAKSGTQVTNVNRASGGAGGSSNVNAQADARAEAIANANAQAESNLHFSKPAMPRFHEMKPYEVKSLGLD